MNAIRFTTKSGAIYDLIVVEGETIITRDAEHPVLNRTTGEPMPTIVGMRCTGSPRPVVGESFAAFTKSHGYLTTTPVVSIEEVEAAA